jgi:hypothetical protein
MLKRWRAELRPHNRDELITKVAVDPGAKCPHFDASIEHFQPIIARAAIPATVSRLCPNPADRRAMLWQRLELEIDVHRIGCADHGAPVARTMGPGCPAHGASFRA